MLEITVHEEMRENTPDDVEHDVSYERLKNNSMERSQLTSDTSAGVRFSSFLE